MLHIHACTCRRQYVRWRPYVMCAKQCDRVTHLGRNFVTFLQPQIDWIVLRNYVIIYANATFRLMLDLIRAQTTESIACFSFGSLIQTVTRTIFGIEKPNRYDGFSFTCNIGSMLFSLQFGRSIPGRLKMGTWEHRKWWKISPTLGQCQHICSKLSAHCIEKHLSDARPI